MPDLLQIGEGFRGRDGHVSFLLRQAHTVFRAEIDRQLAPLGITGPQFSALNVIGLIPGLSGTELARVSMLTQQTTNEILLVLKRRRLIGRRARRGDRRILEVSLTPEGARVVARARRIVSGIERRMMADLDPTEERLFRAWLVSCARSLSEPSSTAAAR